MQTITEVAAQFNTTEAELETVIRQAGFIPSPLVGPEAFAILAAHFTESSDETTAALGLPEVVTCRLRSSVTIRSAAE